MWSASRPRIGGGTRSPTYPSHLLFLDETFGERLIDWQFDKTGRDSFATAIPLAVVDDLTGVAVNVGVKLIEGAKKSSQHYLRRPT